MRGTRHGNWLQHLPMHNTIIDTNQWPITLEEIQSEKLYRIEERLGILCGADVPTDEQMEIAVREASEWEAAYRNLSTPTCNQASPVPTSPDLE
jgi:hypothetical protein